ncbi:MAG: glycosyltransferase family 39 protein [Leifsonia sp.]
MIALRRSGVFLRARPEYVVAAALIVLLIVGSGAYGWHGDELYFVVAGQHPAFGYPDQPLFTPLLVGFMNALGGGSLVVVRLASAVGSAATAVIVGAMAGQLGGGPQARLIGSLSWAVGAVSIVTGHFVDTTTFDVLATAGVCSCLIVAITKNSGRWMVAGGAVLGLGLLNKMVIGAVIALVVLSMLAVGPRRIFATRYAAIAAGLAVVGAAPYLIWQGLHGWPQVELVSGISQSGTEGGSVGVIPFQILLVSPFLVAFWIAGIVRLFRAPDARPFRGFAIAYLVLIVLLIASSGKAYYAAGLLPVLVAAGGVSLERWIAGRARALKITLTAVAMVLALAINAVIGLPVIPASALGSSIVEKLNPDAGSQVGWPSFMTAVDKAYTAIPTAERNHAVILTFSYSEAGAVDKFGNTLGLPQAFSGHNGFAGWGPPTGTGPVVMVGYSIGSRVAAKFVDCRTITHVDNHLGLNNDEQGQPILLCAHPRKSWAKFWPSLIHYQ